MAIRYGDRTRVSSPVIDWLNRQELFTEYSTVVIPSTATTTITADTNAHTYGAWTELVASLSIDACMLEVGVQGIRANGTNTASVISIGTGSAGNETEICAVAVGGAGDASVGMRNSFQIPIAIPSGTRIVARFQSIITLGKTAVVDVIAFGVSKQKFPLVNNAVDSIGLNLATSRGTAISASSAYSQIIASTTADYRGVVIVPSQASASTSALNISMTVAVGGSGSEIDIGSIYLSSSAGEGQWSNHPSFFLPAFIPGGSRLSVKQSSSAVYFDATLIGVRF